MTHSEQIMELSSTWSISYGGHPRLNECPHSQAQEQPQEVQSRSAPWVTM